MSLFRRLRSELGRRRLDLRVQQTGVYSVTERNLHLSGALSLIVIGRLLSEDIHDCTVLRKESR